MGVIYRIILFLVFFNMAFFALKYGDDWLTSAPSPPPSGQGDESAIRLVDETEELLSNVFAKTPTVSVKQPVPMLKNGGGDRTVVDSPQVRTEYPEGFDGQLSFDKLLDSLGSVDPLMRIAALNEIAMRYDARAIAFIEPLLFDPDKGVRVEAIRTLGDLESELAVIPLAALLNDADASIRRHAVIALGEIGGDGAAGFVDAMLSDPDRVVAINATAVLNELSLEQGNRQ